MADAIPITRARASNPDLRGSLALFDDVVDRLCDAVALEEDVHVAVLAGEIFDDANAPADVAITGARTALQHAVGQPYGHHPAAWVLCSALHTLNIALLSEEVREQRKALALVSSHPALNPVDDEGPVSGLVAARLHRLRDLVERLQALIDPELDDTPAAADFPTP